MIVPMSAKKLIDLLSKVRDQNAPITFKTTCDGGCGSIVEFQEVFVREIYLPDSGKSEVEIVSK